MRGLMLAMLLVGSGAPALAVDQAAQAEAPHDTRESRLPDWRVLALACAGLIVGRVVMVRRAGPKR